MPTGDMEEVARRADADRLSRLAGIKEALEQSYAVDAPGIVTLLAGLANKTAKAQGFWKDWPLLVGAVVDEPESTIAFYARLYLATKIALIHEEGSETLRALRKEEDLYAALGGMADELCDTIIRCHPLCRSTRLKRDDE